MIDIEQADHVQLLTDATGKLWVNVQGKCQLRIGKVATLQLDFDSNQYVSNTKDGRFIVRRHESGTNCWCGRTHPSFQQVKQARPIEGKFR